MTQHRNGKPTKVIPDGHPRRLADGRNAFRKMNAEQREEFAWWMLENGLNVTLKNNEDKFLDHVLAIVYQKPRPKAVGPRPWRVK